MVRASSWKRTDQLSDGFAAFDSRAVANLLRIISQTGVDTIVLTTSHKSNYTLSQWREIFIERSINVFIEKLEDNHSNLSRKDEVLNWIEYNFDECFVIIDDDKSLNELPSYYKEKLVLTSPMVGLNEWDSLAAIAILNMEEPAFA